MLDENFNAKVDVYLTLYPSYSVLLLAPSELFYLMLFGVDLSSTIMLNVSFRYFFFPQLSDFGILTSVGDYERISHNSCPKG